MLNKDNCNFEICLYRLLGVLWFKKIVLKYEEIVHRKYGRTLKNYHPESLSIYGLRKYAWYVIYNCFLHCLSILFSGVYFVITFINDVYIWAMDLVVWILIIFNIYCILLQRYNKIKLNQLCKYKDEIQERKFEKYCRKIESIDLLFLCKEEYDEDMLLLKKVEKAFNLEEDCSIGEYDVRSLERYFLVLKEAGINSLASNSSKNMLDKSKSVISSLNDMEPYKHVDILVSALRVIFDKKNYLKERRNIVLVTENEKCEECYRRVFGIGTSESVLFQIKILKYIYANKIQVEK